jgi:hypothetical protein
MKEIIKEHACFPGLSIAAMELNLEHFPAATEQ